VYKAPGDRPMLAASRSQAAASGNAVGVGRAKKLFMSDRVGLIHEVANNEVRGGVAEKGSMGMLGGGAWHQFLPANLNLARLPIPGTIRIRT